jgi:hypothetical protein
VPVWRSCRRVGGGLTPSASVTHPSPRPDRRSSGGRAVAVARSSHQLSHIGGPQTIAMAGRYPDACPGAGASPPRCSRERPPPAARGAIWCTTTWPGTALTGPTRRQLPHKSGDRGRARAGTNTERWVQIPPVPPQKSAAQAGLHGRSSGLRGGELRVAAGARTW